LAEYKYVKASPYQYNDYIILSFYFSHNTLSDTLALHTERKAIGSLGTEGLSLRIEKGPREVVEFLKKRRRQQRLA